MSRLRKILAGRSGEGYIDVAVLILCVMLVLALSVKILPVFIAKQQLDTFATELCREAEITGRIGSETNRRAAVLPFDSVRNHGIFPSEPDCLRGEGSPAGCSGCGGK